jgi:hypothetical protein
VSTVKSVVQTSRPKEVRNEIKSLGPASSGAEPSHLCEEAKLVIARFSVDAQSEAADAEGSPPHGQEMILAVDAESDGAAVRHVADRLAEETLPAGVQLLGLEPAPAGRARTPRWVDVLGTAGPVLSWQNGSPCIPDPPADATIAVAAEDFDDRRSWADSCREDVARLLQEWETGEREDETRDMGLELRSLEGRLQHVRLGMAEAMKAKDLPFARLDAAGDDADGRTEHGRTV